MKKTFSPEFLNRIDDVLIFNSLEKEHMRKIIHIVAKSLLKRIEDLGLSLKIEEDAMDFLVEKDSIHSLVRDRCNERFKNTLKTR